MSWRYGIALSFALAVGCAEAGKEVQSEDDNGSSNGGSGGTQAAGGTGGSAGPGPGGAGPGPGAGGGEPTGLLPDPGSAMDSWTVANSSPTPGSGVDVGKPSSAWKVGTATQAAPYVQANLSPTTGSAFYVFTAGPALTEITIALTGSGYTAIHLHDGSGLVFGDKIEATSGGPTSGTWTVVPSNIYAVEIVGPNGQFF